MQIRTRSRALLAAAVALLVAGGSAGTAMAKQTKITAMVATFDGLTAKLLNQIARNYEAKHPDIDIVMNATSWLGESGWAEKLTTYAAAGVLPDVFYMRSAIIPWFSGTRGIVEPIDKYVAASHLDTKQWPKYVFPACSYGGALYGLPYTSEIQWVFYNREVMSQAGLPDLEAEYATGNWSIDTMALFATKATKYKGTKVDIPGLSISLGGPYQSPGWVWSFGGDIWSEEKNQCVADSPQAMEAWRYMADLAFKKKALYAVDMAGAMAYPWESIVNGKFGMHVWLDGFVGVWESAKNKFKMNMMPFPKGPKSDENILASTEIMSVSKASKNKKAAYDFAAYLCSDEALRSLVVEHGSFAPKRSMASLWAKSQVDRGRTGAKYAADMLDRTRPHPKLARYTKAEEAMRPFWNNAWTGKTELQQAMTQAAKEANKWLSRK